MKFIYYNAVQFGAHDHQQFITTEKCGTQKCSSVTEQIIKIKMRQVIPTIKFFLNKISEKAHLFHKAHWWSIYKIEID